jgi:hypothetical protein
VPTAVHAGFVADQVALGQVPLRVLRFSPVRAIPPLLHIHSCIIWRMDSARSSTETQSDPIATVTTSLAVRGTSVLNI